MITRCPRCRTAFRVTETQLQARGGQVRCGRCDAIFDAHATLTSPSPAAVPGIRASFGGEGAPTAPDRKPRARGAGNSPHAKFDFGWPPRVRASRWWWVASALALLALGGQGAYRYRGDIATLLPEAKPLLARLCVQFRCEIPLPRRVDLLSIESSDLQADSANPSVMVLTATLRNRAAFAQALPALELSLTNPQDQTVARRVLNPREYVPRGTHVETGFAPGGELQVRVYMEAETVKATGYRLYLFYP